MKIITIVGARPQFVKAAVVSRAIAENGQINEVIVHTGQHYDPNMSDVFFQEMKIPEPDYLLDVNGSGHGAMTGRMLEKIESVLLKEQPDCMLVYGDTNSTLAGALAASKLHIPVAHVEAGLRSFNRRMPEEINRIVTDHVSSVLFCPTDSAIKNLVAEGIGVGKKTYEVDVYQVGDVMLDASLYFEQFSRPPAFDLPEKFILATLHRAENTDRQKNLKDIFAAFHEIGRSCPVVLPLHPRTRKKLQKSDIEIDPGYIHIVEPVSYLVMLYLINSCELVLTDSGGLQKEASFFGKSCITLREETEWVELLEVGVNRLAGANTGKIVKAWQDIPWEHSYDTRMMYGNGKAAQQIVSKLIDGFLK
ncbi:MAG: UDP-N-acetylglucosamine 2-epimerase (non-hydrolyzing) [Desulfocapsa sp.]|nr:UDP-N-acetylglucosamine 2-epimerase (non-hydrolyzing) [Desulfocapsa sp.]